APYEALGTPASLELNAVTGSGLFHPPFEAGASTTRWNLDGLLTYDRSREDQGAHAYAQLFRTGIHEGVEASMIGHLQSDRPGPPIFYGGWMDASLGRHLANPVRGLGANRSAATDRATCQRSRNPELPGRSSQSHFSHGDH